jgi:selenide,water dikinase
MSPEFTQKPLTLLAATGGCAAKLGPGDLSRLLKSVNFRDPAGTQEILRREDVGTFPLGPFSLLLQSIDIIAPISDDPHTFGGVAAANALSDIYAKGGQPITGLIALAFPPAEVLDQTAAAIVQGAADKLAEARARVVGGHTVVSRELLAGVSVAGIAGRIVSNVGAQSGDSIILTKPIGVGIISTAQKLVHGGSVLNGFSPDAQLQAEQAMLTLNAHASEVLTEPGVHACTDVTGFGLVGHLLEVC